MISELGAFLQQQKPGPLSDSDELKDLLIREWDLFQGSREGGMEPYKLTRKLEGLDWSPPVFSFTIERHGSVCRGGSKFAQLQRWSLDVVRETARMSIAGTRLISAREPRLNVAGLAEEVAVAILAGSIQPFLKWRTDGSVQTIPGKLIPAERLAKTTLEGRRKKFRMKLGELLGKNGWEELRTNSYARRHE